LARSIRKSIKIAQSVMIQHTLFSLPFAASALLLETSGVLPKDTLLWIFLAILGARNGANALNRLIDHSIDELNPRTKGRHLPSGELKRVDLWVFTIFCLALLIVSTFMLNWLCLVLLPVALAMIIGYSYTKRYTWLCHYVLGITVAIAPMGTLLAINGSFKLSYFIVSAAVALWVAGFDIIYATQDVDFDREQNLHSVPERFGVRGGLSIAAISHLLSLILLIVWGSFYDVGYLYYIGTALVGILLFFENGIVAPGKLTHVTTAAYHINEIVSVLFFLFVMAEVYLS